MDDYKEKYKQAVKKIKDLFNEGEQKGFTIITYRKDFEKIFPELKEEPEDERIRKELIRVFSNREKYRIAQPFGDITVSEALTWLKKQGKKEPKETFVWKHWKDGIAGNASGEPIYLIKNGYTYSLSSCLGCECDYILLSDLDKLRQGELKPISFDDSAMIDSYLNDYCCKIYNALHKENGGLLSYARLQHLAKDIFKWCKENQDEQKSTDKPTFKVGDWVVHDMSDGRKAIRQIVNMTNKSYVLDGEDFDTFYFNDLEDDYHLWTIQDAKDGDVLVDEDINIIGIFEGIEGMYWHSRLYYSSVTKELYGIECGGSHQKEFAKPATKEQRDTLIKAMTDAGYTFDFEKKELKKTEQSPKWKGNKDLEAAILGAHPTFKQNPAWSEEDERNLQGIIDEINANKNNAPDYDLATYDRFLSWIKSLKERIGGKAWEY